MGEDSYGINMDAVQKIASDVKATANSGIELCLVIGGGNIFRGLAASVEGMDRSNADFTGMLATVMNALAFQDALEKKGVPTRIQSAIPMATVCEPYIRRRAVRHMEKGRVVIFAAGTGNPFFSTDTAATLRALELQCDVLLKGTQVDGIYADDPRKKPKSKRYSSISYTRILEDDLHVMDATAISLARDNALPVIVFSIHTKNACVNAVRGKGRYTLITKK